jgi:hypothetical protein
MKADIWDIRLFNPSSGSGLSDVEQRKIERHQA